MLVSGDVVGRRGLFATNDDDALGRRIAMMLATEKTDFIIYSKLLDFEQIFVLFYHLPLR